MAFNVLDRTRLRPSGIPVSNSLLKTRVPRMSVITTLVWNDPRSTPTRKPAFSRTLRETGLRPKALELCPDSTTNPLSIRRWTMAVMEAALNEVREASSIREMLRFAWMSCKTFNSLSEDLDCWFRMSPPRVLVALTLSRPFLRFHRLHPNSRQLG